MVIPKSVTPARIQENFKVSSPLRTLQFQLKVWLNLQLTVFHCVQVFDFSLTADEVKTILGFNRNFRVCPMQW